MTPWCREHTHRVSLSTKWSLWSSRASRPRQTWQSGWTGWSCRALVALLVGLAGFARLAGGTLGPTLSLRSLLSIRSCRPEVTLGTREGGGACQCVCSCMASDGTQHAMLSTHRSSLRPRGSSVPLWSRRSLKHNKQFKHVACTQQFTAPHNYTRTEHMPLPPSPAVHLQWLTGGPGLPLAPGSPCGPVPPCRKRGEVIR